MSRFSCGNGGVDFLLDTRARSVHNGDMAKSRNELFELRQEAHFYRAQHSRACKRESVLKQRVAELEQVVCSQKSRLGELTQLVETLKARIAWLTRQLFGNRSEVSDKSDFQNTGDVGHRCKANLKILAADELAIGVFLCHNTDSRSAAIGLPRRIV